MPVVAASVGVASSGGSEVVALLNLMTWIVCTPVVSGRPSQVVSVIFTGTVLFSLKARTGSAYVPPVASAPPMGGWKPSNPTVSHSVAVKTA